MFLSLVLSAFTTLDFLHHFKEFLFIGKVDQTYRRKVNVKAHSFSSIDLFALVYLNTLNKSIDDSRCQFCNLGTAGALKGKITVSTLTEIQMYTLGAEHRFRLFLSVDIFLLLAVTVKDTAEIYINEDIQKCLIITERLFVFISVAI